MTTTRLRKHKYWLSPATEYEVTSILIITTKRTTIRDNGTSYVITNAWHVVGGCKPMCPYNGWNISNDSKFIPLTEAKYNLLCNIVQEDT